MSETVLQEAERIINGQRREDYGGVTESFNLIGGMWSAYLGINVSAHDVANLMVLLKVARAKNGFHRDSYVDIAGYAGCTEKLDAEASAAVEPVDLDEPKPAPRVWRYPAEVPESVTVTDIDGVEFTRAHDHDMWIIYPTAGPYRPPHGPLTEVIG
ncbi:DUF6378 domain-containing protein [Mycobacterium intracellulare]|uniref:DUF6378 domain-containing protein n=1 Tax=Mycobacterium intracellulare TaxID=1767 RepID=A0AAE4UCG9_MYCIT|nr:DUF6378 domain-containing protein [Mycobacterium intracellulare]MDV6975290.1 DUF6378 domain-containing protein [Mycobacterium intracellulare]MDV6980354.1 DUF6378 domain-containing protein [Mycobacterium intracellulare]MDV7010783.1 DUF6378 domain-containing protein [Mycobacterium intracellulare]MDV7025689.1 DUF6378 domain-containing protein [Mycobacterium intracellulare]